MYVAHLHWGPPGALSVVHPGPTNSAFMFGTFDPAIVSNSESIRALDDTLLGIREDDDPKPVVIHHHSHANAAIDGSSSAFMFGVHPEQGYSTAPAGLCLYLLPSELD